jgi:hypothetical protein
MMTKRFKAIETYTAVWVLKVCGGCETPALFLIVYLNSVISLAALSARSP